MHKRVFFLRQLCNNALLMTDCPYVHFARTTGVSICRAFQIWGWIPPTVRPLLSWARRVNDGGKSGTMNFSSLRSQKARVEKKKVKVDKSPSASKRKTHRSDFSNLLSTCVVQGLRKGGAQPTNFWRGPKLSSSCALVRWWLRMDKVVLLGRQLQNPSNQTWCQY